MRLVTSSILYEWFLASHFISKNFLIYTVCIITTPHACEKRKKATADNVYVYDEKCGNDNVTKITRLRKQFYAIHTQNTLGWFLLILRFALNFYMWNYIERKKER